MQNVLCTQIKAPVIEPVSVSDVLEHTITDIEDAKYLNGLIPRARKRFEQITGRFLVEQTWRFAMPKFPLDIEIPYAPLQKVSSIEYINSQGQLESLQLDDYRVVNYGIKPSLTPALGKYWPSPGYKVADAVQVECVLGHAQVEGKKIDESTIIDEGSFELAKQAILILVADWYRNREDSAAVQLYSVPNAFSAICTELSVNLI